MTSVRPAGVTALAIAFLAAAGYLLAIGITMLARPEWVSISAGADLLGGLRFAGAPVFLWAALIGAVIAGGLWKLQRWARWAAILAAIYGVLLLVPIVSGAVVFFRLEKLAWGGMGVMIRTIIVLYLFQEPVREAFTAK